MGLLKQGHPITWPEAIPLIQYVKEHGIIQFINIYNRLKERKDDVLKWGDEVEYMLVHFDNEKKKVALDLSATDILGELQKPENEYVEAKSKNETPQSLPQVSWKPEYGRFMLEGTPFFPYDGSLKSLTLVEVNMNQRRNEVEALLKPNQYLASLSMFPQMGSGEFLYPWPEEPTYEITQSLYAPDNIISPHPRFGTLTKNIRLRRGGKVCILSPLYIDENTDKSIGVSYQTKSHIPSHVQIDMGMAPASPTQYLANPTKSYPTSTLEHKPCIAKTPSIYTDAMAFGMGCCCLQATFQARDITEARNLYDQLAVLCPLMLAVTASTPIVRGLLADTDVRWNIVSASVDDRTPKEKLEISKSRYDSISLYIGTTPEAVENSDLNVKINHEAFEKLTAAGIDSTLATHIAHLFIRDPLVIFTDCKEVDDENETDHFENIQSTNWQTMRFKPPPANSNIGWRVEFRVMEVQQTDFENAAFITFVVLLTRTILTFGLNFYTPISKVDENLAKAHKRDAVNTEKFYFRKNIVPSELKQGEKPEFDYFSINELINGSAGKFVGLIPLVRRYLDQMSVDLEVRVKLEQYIDFVSKKASGELLTTASYFRKLVTSHPSYKKDSVVTSEIAYDLLSTMRNISSGKLRPSELI